LIQDCRFPELPEPYDSALREAVAYVLDRVEPLGIIASGTIVRGNPAGRIADRTAGARGFFEWESDPDEVTGS
jgi:hypothetical protein